MNTTQPHLARRLPTSLLAFVCLALVACGDGDDDSPLRLNTSVPSSALYAIGGTVSGLTGSGGTLVLQNDSTDPLNLTADGTFQFANKVTAYAVTVHTQPAPSQCSVTQGSGTAIGDVNTVTVNCGVFIHTWAGDGTADFLNGPSANARFLSPFGVALDASDNVYVADTINNRIRKIDANGTVSTLAGSGTAGMLDGSAATAQFNTPYGVAVDASDNVYVADYGNNSIRMIAASGQVSTLAGNGTAGWNDGPAASAQFRGPTGVAVDAIGNVYVADAYNHLIRKISTSGSVSTVAGNGTTGITDGLATSAQFNDPYGIAIDSTGNLYIADYAYGRIRKITPSGQVSTLAGPPGSTQSGFQDGPATTALFNSPTGIAVDASGNLYVADAGNSRIRKLDTSGNVSTFAGGTIDGFQDGPALTSALFNFPTGVALDATGNLYIADQSNNRIRSTLTPPTP